MHCFCFVFLFFFELLVSLSCIHHFQAQDSFIHHFSTPGLQTKVESFESFSATSAADTSVSFSRWKQGELTVASVGVIFWCPLVSWQTSRCTYITDTFSDVLGGFNHLPACPEL